MWSFPVDFKNIFASKTGFFTILPHVYTDGNIYNHLAHVEVKVFAALVSPELPGLPLQNDVGKVTAYHGDAYDVDALNGYDKDTDTM